MFSNHQQAAHLSYNNKINLDSISNYINQCTSILTAPHRCFSFLPAIPIS